MREVSGQNANASVQTYALHFRSEPRASQENDARACVTYKQIPHPRHPPSGLTKGKGGIRVFVQRVGGQNDLKRKDV